MRTGRYGNVQRGRIGVALVCLLLLMTALAGCSRLLPRSQEVTRSKWHSFEQIKAAYDQIVPGSSLADLAAMGFDLEKTPNLQLLNATELAVLFQSTPPEALPPELQGCLNQPDACRACVYDLQRLHSRRVGNFWADFFNFHRKTSVSGWRFKMLLVLHRDQVVYRPWSGTAAIATCREERNPLGPLQSSGDRLLRLAY
ncbi:MAG: hypothetical protein M0O99_06105 [Desulfuromonas thiophila]|jgi:hypothetical protein|nr:hypothetical protein [Desulfuromonas thiophila]